MILSEEFVQLLLCQMREINTEPNGKYTTHYNVYLVPPDKGLALSEVHCLNEHTLDTTSALSRPQ